ncbi:MAG TPA: carboxypeptidase-like regulatory domain-containing protein [Chitinophagales bacterium]|nr:carboxypeptidase-like regulatory domain-containing protein [Chitinophagales bacterium]
MKTQNTIRAAGMLLLLFAAQLSFALTGGSIMGQVIDPETKEPVGFANVLLESQGTQKAYTTDENGYYYASNIPAGIYTVTVSLMSNKSQITDIKLGNEETLTVNVEFNQSVTLTETVITVYQEPLIDRIDAKMGVLDNEALGKMPIQKISQVAEIMPATVKIGNDYYVRGARAGGLAYYIDGGKVMGSPDIPLCGLDTYRMYSGYIPAKYGDALGGVVVIETRNYFSEH